ncbi:ZIP zinc transporter domain-containing protein [Hirsutella rhossiliensis]|uniref:ZIP zinc transporter domain-containing protein n=1 Tax=Hirsutella rhossiliensis TaxID=111463 RepID=A0A9P8MYK0_9HYPO|nr:ZIP zinc transporter domain-containing protein [Hirsutella rhossiliensis]KAH0963594.1 ZIP zinc transporter domain-containing protein [Hirsutella rhossiliensis]
MAGIFLLLSLCVVMALASFLAGALPLSMTLSHSQLRLISSIGVGVLVGTSLIVIIPEGIQAAVTPASSSHAHRARSLAQRAPWKLAIEERYEPTLAPAASIDLRRDMHGEQGHAEIPAFEVGFSMVLGFVLMFLIDRLPRHATETFQSGPQTTHMSLDSLGVDGALADDEADGFLGSLTPTPRRARSLATTIGLVIHAAADGIAMGASSATSNMKLGLIIFIAIMIHKAPAAFGLTSVLLRQGLSKRAARGHLIVFSMAAPVGALATWLLIKLLGGDDLGDAQGQWWTGMLLLFSGGTFLYVAMHAMEEDGTSHSHDHGSGANGMGDAWRGRCSNLDGGTYDNGGPA